MRSQRISTISEIKKRNEKLDEADEFEMITS